jgi:hypothetical protein
MNLLRSCIPGSFVLRDKAVAKQASSHLSFFSRNNLDPGNIRDYALLDIGYNPISVYEPTNFEGGHLESLWIISTRSPGLPGSHPVESLVCSSLAAGSDPDFN